MTIRWLYRQYPFLLANTIVAAITRTIIKKTKRRIGIIQYFGEDVEIPEKLYHNVKSSLYECTQSYF